MRPDFSGVWQLNVEKSTFRGPAPKALLVSIQHDDSRLTQITLIVTSDGREQRQVFTYDMGGESTNTIAFGEARSRTRWNGSELVIASELTTSNRTFHFSDHWLLSPDGQILQMAHRDDDLAGQVAVLERASPETAARFTGP